MSSSSSVSSSAGIRLSTPASRPSPHPGVRGRFTPSRSRPDLDGRHRELPVADAAARHLYPAPGPGIVPGVRLLLVRAAEIELQEAVAYGEHQLAAALERHRSGALRDTVA